MRKNNSNSNSELEIKPKLYNIFSSATVIIWTAALAVIMTLLLFFHKKTEYMYKITFQISNVALLLIAIVTAVAFVSIYIQRKEHIDRFFKKIKLKHIIIATVILFAVQLFVFYHIYFKTEWDVCQILEAAEGIAAGVSDTNTQLYYFRRYPNNLLMTWIFSVIMKACNGLGLTSVFAHIYAITVFNCILFATSAVLLFLCLKKTVRNAIIPVAAWVLYWLNVGFNPYLTIPYSDALSIIFPIAILYAYQCMPNGKLSPLKWALIITLSLLGFKIKPQILIAFIAIVICETAKFICRYDLKARLKNTKSYAIGALSAAVIILITNLGLTQLPVKLDKESEFGFSHFLMMGFNEERSGAYLQSDVDFSGQFATSEERTKANIEVFRQRVKNYGFTGLAKFMAKKCLLNFGDGTYAWGVEGNFYLEVPEVKSEKISPFLRSYFYTYGENYHTFATFQQYLWIIILTGNLGILFIFKDKKLRETMAAPILALVGLTVFEMLLEPRARYLFHYSSIFIFTAIVGWYAILKTVYRSRLKTAPKAEEEEEGEKQ